MTPQLEEVLNRTSPFSIFLNGENMDALEQEGRRQNKEFKNLEEKYVEMADGVDGVFSDSMKVLTLSRQSSISRSTTTCSSCSSGG